MFGNKELQILFHMSQGKCSVAELSECLRISVPETYRKIRMLRSKDIVQGKDPIEISCCPHAKRLLALMSESPGMARFLSGSGLEVLASLSSPMTVREISEATGLSESHVRKVLKTEREGGFVRRVDDAYILDDDALPRIQPFLRSYGDYMEVSDPRLPNDSEILARIGGDVVFSSRRDQEFRPAGPSAFGDFGMKGIPNRMRFFTTYAGEMTIDRVFEEAVLIADAKDDWRLRLFNELFYIMNQGKLNPSPDFLANHRIIMSGGRIEHWPSRQDIEDRMWMVKG